MAAAPFTGQASRQDWLLVARLLNRQSDNDYNGAAQYLWAVDVPLEALFFDNSARLPGFLACAYRDFVLYSFTGTASVFQWLFHILNAKPIPWPQLPGKVGGYFAVIATQVYGRTVELGDEFVRAALDKPVVCVGHSMGATTAILVASLMAQGSTTVRGVYGIGMPNPGDTAFAQALPFPVYALNDVDDPIALLPPAGELTVNLPSRLFGILPFPVPKPTSVGGFYPAYTQANGLRPDGQIGLWAPLWSTEEGLGKLLSGEWEGHLSATYLQRLIQGAACYDQLPGTGGYPAPWLLFDQPGPHSCGQVPRPLPNPGPAPPPALVQPGIRGSDSAARVNCRSRCLRLLFPPTT